MNYKAGDTVIVRKWDDMEREFGVDTEGAIKAKVYFVKLMRVYCGKSVTIRSVTSNGNYHIEGSPFVFSEDTFEKDNTQKIVITSDGKETLARLYDGKKVVKKATAQCSPNDTFDFKTGAMLAFERLMNDGKKPLTFREKLKQEHPQKVDERCGGGCYGCPKDYDYINEECPLHKTVKTCRECWDREIPEDKPKKEEKPFKFEVGKQYIGSNTNGSLVIKITRQYRRGLINKYEFEVLAGKDVGPYGFEEVSDFANRLKPYEPPKYFNGKAVCIEVGNKFYAYTKGKVYEFKDGKTINDNNIEVHTDGVTSIAEWNKRYGQRAKMLEIVE